MDNSYCKMHNNAHISTFNSHYTYTTVEKLFDYIGGLQQKHAESIVSTLMKIASNIKHKRHWFCPGMVDLQVDNLCVVTTGCTGRHVQDPVGRDAMADAGDVLTSQVAEHGRVDGWGHHAQRMLLGQAVMVSVVAPSLTAILVAFPQSVHVATLSPAVLEASHLGAIVQDGQETEEVVGLVTRDVDDPFGTLRAHIFLRVVTVRLHVTAPVMMMAMDEERSRSDGRGDDSADDEADNDDLASSSLELGGRLYLHGGGG